MHPSLRVTVATALAFICLEGNAKVNDKCISMLEARPSTVEPQPPKTPCPIAIGYTRSPRAPAVRLSVQGPSKAFGPEPGQLAGEAPSQDESTDESQPAPHPSLHV